MVDLDITQVAPEGSLACQYRPDCLLNHPVVAFAWRLAKETLDQADDGEAQATDEDWAVDETGEPITDHEVAAYNFNGPPPGRSAPELRRLQGQEGVEARARLWAQYMLEHSPRGYDVFELSTGWEWGRAGQPVDADVWEGLTQPLARRGAWLDYLQRHTSQAMELAVQSLDRSGGAT